MPKVFVTCLLDILFYSVSKIKENIYGESGIANTSLREERSGDKHI